MVCMMQEFLHIHYPQIPEARMWHWQMLPPSANVDTVGSRFDSAGILPSLRFLVRYAVPTSSLVKQRNLETLILHGMRSIDYRRPTSARVSRSTMPNAFWIGADHLFFYVEDEEQQGIANCRLPQTVGEDLPEWVVPLLADVSMTDEIHVKRNLDAALEQFAKENDAPAVRLLRSINWARLPLVWQPMFLVTTHHGTVQQCEEAQVRLIRSVAREWESGSAEVVHEALTLLQHVTTMVQ